MKSIYSHELYTRTLFDYFKQAQLKENTENNIFILFNYNHS